MSLEQALLANTTAIQALIAQLQAAPVVAAETPVVKPAKPKAEPKPKPDFQKDLPSETLASGVVSVTETIYFFTEKNDVVYEIQPGEPLQILSGAVRITADEFAAHKARIDAKFAHLSKPADEVTSEVLMAKVVELSQQANGRAEMQRILAGFGAAKFSLVPADKRADAMAQVEAAIL